ncbi:PorT family protein [Aurantibacter crassamenti]|uniref:porin family protein n=1 Tax=Aurantibacter crassamenti TaxID=1837375 RepID=UPI00193991E6|nr:porin family protein [Aurantibacter crassamenti]MBM1107880.1 PorT family protein [Aurantibacter crassamenti]
MKKALLLAIVTFAIAAQQMNAQVFVQDKTTSSNSGSSGDIRFGAKAGLNISTFINKDYFDVTPKAGGFVGGLVEIPITDEIYAQPELLVSIQGANIGPGDLNLVYVHVPLMGKYHITDEIAAEFGPQLSFVLNDNASDYVNNGAELKTNTLQVALNFGGGYRLNDNIYFQARFSLGMTKTVVDSTVKNGILQIGAAYIF